MINLEKIEVSGFPKTRDCFKTGDLVWIPSATVLWPTTFDKKKGLVGNHIITDEPMVVLYVSKSEAPTTFLTGVNYHVVMHQNKYWEVKKDSCYEVLNQKRKGDINVD